MIGHPNVVALRTCALVGIAVALCCLHAFLARIVPPVALVGHVAWVQAGNPFRKIVFSIDKNVIGISIGRIVTDYYSCYFTTGRQIVLDILFRITS